MGSGTDARRGTDLTRAVRRRCKTVVKKRRRTAKTQMGPSVPRLRRRFLLSLCSSSAVNFRSLNSNQHAKSFPSDLGSSMDAG